MTIAAIIVAAGKGQRAGGSVPKQYQHVAGEPIIKRSIIPFLNIVGADNVVVVYNPDDHDLYLQATKGLPLPPPVAGGTTRAASVFNGLKALKNSNFPPEHVLIHDAARCLVTEQEILDVIEALKLGHDAAVPCLPSTDSLKLSKDGKTIESDVDRATTWRALTPQGFDFDKIFNAHQSMDTDQKTDDIAIATEVGLNVALVKGSDLNFKITTARDFDLANHILTNKQADMNQSDQHQQHLPDVRTALGFDVHKFDDGDHVILCGLKIPHSYKLKGHSDADVALHAITDALLGTIAAGDIGDHFPPSDAQWAGASSDLFLKHAAKLITDKGGVINHIDLTIICEAPKLMAHKRAMADNIANMLNMSADKVSVKATTTEKLGFTGRSEGIAAQASATVYL